MKKTSNFLQENTYNLLQNEESVKLHYRVAEQESK